MSLRSPGIRIAAKSMMFLIVLLIFSGILGFSSSRLITQANTLGYYQISSNQSGPNIMITGGIHGDEPAGYTAAERLLDYEIDQGTMYIFTQVNKYGINNTERLFKDGRDLNRSFLAKDDMPSVRLADRLLTFIEKQKVDLVLDLHESEKCAKVDKNYVGQTLITSDNLLFTAVEVAEKLNQSIAKAEHQFRAETSPVAGSLTWATAEKFDMPAVTVETCKKLELAARVEHHIKIVTYFLQEEGVDLYEASEKTERVKKVITY